MRRNPRIATRKSAKSGSEQERTRHHGAYHLPRDQPVQQRRKKKKEGEEERGVYAYS
jgi:hypothetical protein